MRTRLAGRVMVGVDGGLVGGSASPGYGLIADSYAELSGSGSLVAPALLCLYDYDGSVWTRLGCVSVESARSSGEQTATRSETLTFAGSGEADGDWRVTHIVVAKSDPTASDPHTDSAVYVVAGLSEQMRLVTGQPFVVRARLWFELSSWSSGDSRITGGSVDAGAWLSAVLGRIAGSRAASVKLAKLRFWYRGSEVTDNTPVSLSVDDAASTVSSTGWSVVYVGEWGPANDEYVDEFWFETNDGVVLKLIAGQRVPYTYYDGSTQTELNRVALSLSGW